MRSVFFTDQASAHMKKSISGRALNRKAYQFPVFRGEMNVLDGPAAIVELVSVSSCLGTCPLLSQKVDTRKSTPEQVFVILPERSIPVGETSSGTVRTSSGHELRKGHVPQTGRAIADGYWFLVSGNDLDRAPYMSTENLPLLWETG
jgi:hypothetical protein